MPPLPSLIRRHSEEFHPASLSAFEAETMAAIRLTSPRYENAAFYAVGLMFLLAFLLMSVVKLDRIVDGEGKIVTTQGSLFVQPLDKAQIHEIKVQAGEVVKKGEVLATLDPTFAAADLTQLQQKLSSTQALVDRLEAERDGKIYAPPNMDQYQQLQERYFVERQAEYRQALLDFDARTRSSQAAMVQAQQDAGLYGQRLGLANKVETMETTLESHGNGSQLKSLSASDSRAEIARLMTESQNGAAQSRHDRESLSAQRSAYISHFQSGVASDLVDAQTTLAQTQQDLAKATKVNDFITLVAPEDAVVLRIADASAGSMVDTQSAQPLFTLTPLDGALEAEVKIGGSQIGFLAPGQNVQLKIDAFDYRRHGTAKGVIKSISDGSFTLDENKQSVSPYFKARVAITDVAMHGVPSTTRLIPGMTLTGEILAGKRTLLSYLTDGLRRTGSEAMREP